MREQAQSIRSGWHDHEERIKESDHIQKKIAFLKEPNSPSPHLSKLSDARSKWNKYLPAENINNQDHYRQSLERRLQKLFKEEKDMLKERHYPQSNINQIQRKIVKNISNESKQFAGSNSIDRMERKIRQLEQRYRMQQINDKDNKFEVKSNHKTKNISLNKNKEQKQQVEEILVSYGSRQITNQQNNGNKGRSQSEYVKHSKEPTNNSHIQFKEREKMLEEEVEDLKRKVQQIKNNNDQLFTRMHDKQERKKYKQGTKEILLNILHKLEFINIEINRPSFIKTHSSSKTIMERDTEELVKQFKILKTQYRHLEEERKKVEDRQNQIQTKLMKLNSQH